ncbi:ABC transporter ATP-binding protein [Mangrovihabitans endophyticus]|uniref:Nitrate/sulfonate/bicarbonate ABC transporter ATP-binding protein n=1 Tax=Mangrovihabitans endophyticus TaxID=1751298 RepID=A0A8J3C2X6_9ACTN|nr:ABC transporter ATP-binding protein [Mangrovihabitans endophyticus]GGL07544.1 nitrate/sulfonate/bicarbonate ABC transporter ATP-binding protein [Mangrovihabitans endophyticus]
MAGVRVRELRKEFPGGDPPVVAIEDISFTVDGQEFVSVVGPSGCGKSTLLNILSGIDTATRGQVDITQNGRPARLGYVFQSARLLPWRSVLDNLLFVQPARGPADRERCRRYLDMVRLGHTAGQYPGQLSGGMQQRVGIARAFSIEPDLLLMDEPFSHLDAITARSLRRELHDLWQETRKTVLFVTHDVSEAVELSTRILMLAPGGRLVADLPVRLPFPRDPAADEVALARADLLRRFESLDLLAG